MRPRYTTASCDRHVVTVRLYGFMYAYSQRQRKRVLPFQSSPACISVHELSRACSRQQQNESRCTILVLYCLLVSTQRCCANVARHASIVMHMSRQIRMCSRALPTLSVYPSSSHPSKTLQQRKTWLLLVESPHKASNQKCAMNQVAQTNFLCRMRGTAYTIHQASEISQYQQ